MACCNCEDSPKMGRPPIYDLEAEAIDLDLWSQRDDATSLYKFTDKKKYLAQDLSDFARRNETFRLALSKAKERIAIRREEGVHSDTFNYGIWNRSARLYDKMLNDKEDSDADASEARKARAHKVEAQASAQYTKEVLDAVQRNNKPVKGEK